MVDVSKVQQWVQKAVADIAAFDGKLRKVDTDAEKKALSTILSGSNNLTQDDKDYIEGFMLNKSGKTEKINGLKPKKNEARTVEVPYTEPLGASNQEEMNQLKSMYDNVKLFFDDNGNVVRNEIRGKDGEITTVTSVNRLNKDDVEISSEQRTVRGSVITNHGIAMGNVRENGKFVQLDVVEKMGDKVLWEQHTDMATGVITRTFYPNNQIMQNEQFKEFQETGAVASTVTETFVNGFAERVAKDANGNVVSRMEGTYNLDNMGNIMYVSYSEQPVTSDVEKKVAGEGSALNEKELKAE